MIRIFFIIASLLATVADARDPRPARALPNVIFIVADDVGWADPGRYHQHATGRPPVVPTPHIDRLCDQGMMFTDAHLPHALCAPNRFSLITGSYPHRSRPWGTWNRTASSAFHFGASSGDRESNPHRTIGTVMRDKGYRTAYLGKMHFGGDFFDDSGELLRDLANDQLGRIDFTRRFANGLRDHGFDYTFVCPDGIQGPLYAWFENDLYRPVSGFAAEVPGMAAGAPSTLRTFPAGATVGGGEMIQAGYGDSRFDTSEHGPVMTHFARRFMERHVQDHPDKPFLLYFATPAIHVPLTPHSAVAGATGVGLRADFLADLDSQVGHLLATLDQLGIASNTVIIFTSDNGGAIQGGEAMIAAGQHPSGPLRGSKGSIYEGGHRVPFIWKWGDGTPAGSVIPPGTTCNHLVSVMDWVPSLIDLVGGSPAADQHMDSSSLLPLLFSDAPDARPAVRTHHLHFTDLEPARTALRMNDDAGKWLFVRAAGTLPMELYDLSADLPQAVNRVVGYLNPAALPTGHPQRERVLAMNAYFNTYSTNGSARSTPQASYDPSPPTMANAVADPGFELNSATSSYPDADTSPWRIAGQQDDNWGTRIIANNGIAPRGGGNLFSFHYYYLSGDTLVQDVSYPVDASQPHELSYWAALGQASTAAAHVNACSLLLQVQVAASPGGAYSTIKQAVHLPVAGSWTRFDLSLSPAELASHQGGYFRIRLKKVNANTTHRIAVDDFSLTRATPFGSASVKTPIPVPVPLPAVHCRRQAGGFEVVFSGIDPEATWQIEQAEDLAGPWTQVGQVSGATSGVHTVPSGPPRRFFRAVGPDRMERLVLPTS